MHSIYSSMESPWSTSYSFRYFLRLGSYNRKSVEVGVFRRGGHFERKFQPEGAVAQQPQLVSKTRVMALSRGIKISAVHCLVLPQSTRVSDRRTDRITTRKTELA